jgi:hypothetical protein
MNDANENEGPSGPRTTAGDTGLQRESSKKKVPGRPWKPGQSGNPTGKRKATLSPTAALKRSLTRTDLECIIAKLIGQAKAGDRYAMRILFDRVDGPLNLGNIAIAAIQQPVAEPRAIAMVWPHEREAQRNSCSGGNVSGPVPKPG